MAKRGSISWAGRILSKRSGAVRRRFSIRSWRRRGKRVV